MGRWTFVGGRRGEGGSEGEREQDGVDIRGQVCISQAGGKRGVKVAPADACVEGSLRRTRREVGGIWGRGSSPEAQGRGGRAASPCVCTHHLCRRFGPGPSSFLPQQDPDRASVPVLVLEVTPVASSQALNILMMGGAGWGRKGV